METTLGWLNEASAAASFSNRATNDSSRANSAGSSFTATLRPRDSCTAWYTSPMPPLPMSSSSEYPGTVSESGSFRETEMAVGAMGSM